MRSLRSRRTRTGACAAAALVVTAIACGESLPIGPGSAPPEIPARAGSALSTIFDGTTPPVASEFHSRWVAGDPRECVNGFYLHPDSLTEEGERIACAATMTVVAADSLQGLEHAPGVGFTGPITVAFGGPVTDVAIMRYGSTPCEAGSFSGASAVAGDSIVEVQSFEIRSPCEQWIPVLRASGAAAGPKSRPAPRKGTSAYEDFPYITQWAEANYSATGITRLRIDPSLPWTFFNGLDSTTRNARYTVMYRATTQSVASLAVSCAPSPVLRGSVVSCVARRSDNVPLTSVHWVFRSTDPLAPGYEQSEDRDSTWSGPLTVTGRVIASSASPSGPFTDSTGVQVMARNWSGQFPMKYRIDEVPSPYKDPPLDVSQLGENNAKVEFLREPIQLVEGPNTGMFYYDSIPYKLAYDVSLNRAAMKQLTQFWFMQPIQAKTVGGIPYCARRRVVSDTTAVKAHEGFKITDLNSHSEVHYRTFSAFMRQRGDSLVSPTGDFKPMLDSALAKADSASRNDTDGALNPYRPGCYFNYIPGTTP